MQDNLTPGPITAAESSAALRQTMVDCQLRTFEITDRSVLDAVLKVPREIFLPGVPLGLVYSDKILQIGAAGRRSVLAPMVIARLLQSAAITTSDHVLVAGSGTGYTAAIVGQLAAHVIALESDADLSEAAAENLSRAGSTNVDAVTGPLADGLPRRAPFDVIVIDGAIEAQPDTLIGQLKDGGRMTAVLHPAGAPGRRGKAMLYEKNSGRIGSRILFDAAGDLLKVFERKSAFSF